MTASLGSAGSDDPANRYRFRCPTVGDEHAFLDCAERRRRFMRGEPLDRADCRCALAGGKCPADRVIREEYRRGDRLCFDVRGDRLSPLPEQVVRAVEPVVLRPCHAYGAPLTDEQAARLGVRQLAEPPTPAAGTPDAPALAPRPARTAAELCRALIREGLSDEAVLTGVRAVFPNFKRASVNYYRVQIAST